MCGAGGCALAGATAPVRPSTVVAALCLGGIAGDVTTAGCAGETIATGGGVTVAGSTTATGGVCAQPVSIPTITPAKHLAPLHSMGGTLADSSGRRYETFVTLMLSFKFDEVEIATGRTVWVVAAHLRASFVVGTATLDLIEEHAH